MKYPTDAKMAADRPVRVYSIGYPTLICAVSYTLMGGILGIILTL